MQLSKLAALNARRGAYVEEVERGLATVPGLRPIHLGGPQRGGYYASRCATFRRVGGASREKMVERHQPGRCAGQRVGLSAAAPAPIFAQGFDLFTGNRGPLCGDYAGYREGDLPVTERMHGELIFLPVLSDPIPGAAELIVSSLRRASEIVTTL